MKKIITDIRYTLVQCGRSWQALFFTFVFPLLFLVLAWYMFGVASPGKSYMNYVIPGILGIAIMGSALDLTVGFIASYRSTGVLRKLAVTPLSRIEWNLARVMSGAIVALVSAIVTMAVAWLWLGIPPSISVIALLLAIAGAVMFVGIGMIIAYLVHDSDTASAASFTITLPLILVSGTLFPSQQLPGFLQAIAIVSPLTYLNDGLRSAMITGNTGTAIHDLAIVAVLGIVSFVIGLVVLRWRDA